MENSQFSKFRLLVHMHVFHVRCYPELKECLNNLNGLNYDLYVSFSEDHPEIQEDIKNFKSDAVIFKCPNRGYDVAPFLYVLDQVNLDDYDLVIKLHTKRDMESKLTYASCNLSKWRWRYKLLSFLKIKSNLDKTLNAFLEHDDLGMVGNHELILKEDIHTNLVQKQKIYSLASNYMDKYVNIEKYPANKCYFIAGTMFIARAKLLNKIKQLNITYDDFTETGSTKDEFDLAHVFERVICWSITSQTVDSNKSKHYQIKDVFSNPIKIYLHLLHRWFDNNIWYKYRLLRKIGRFVLRLDYIENDTIICIKFFKIPIYRYKNK